MRFVYYLYVKESDQELFERQEIFQELKELMQKQFKSKLLKLKLEPNYQNNK